MPTYITLLNWTDQGVRDVKESPKRLDAYKKLLKGSGGELKGFYLVTGAYDLVVISEAPDDETVAKVALATAARGNVRTQTLRAFSEKEYREIIASLP